MNLPQYLKRIYSSFHEIVAGASFSWAAVPYLLRRRKETENLFILITLLGLNGVSPLPPRYRIFIMPYVIPQILYWRRRLALWDDSLEMADLKHLGH
jgi:hypothetical protein